MSAPVLLSDDQRQLVATLTERLDATALLWLSGYLAGLAQGRAGAAVAAPAVESIPAAAPAAPAAAAGRLTILYGSQTGNAKRQAEGLLAQCEAAGLPVRLVRADRYPTRELKDEHLLYVVISTQGDGEPPDDALAFVEFLTGRRAPKLPDLKFAVLGLGDSSYPSFCGISQQIDERLAALGGQRVLAPGAADVDVDTVADPWRAQALLQARDVLQAPVAASGAGASAAQVAAIGAPAVTRDRPATATLLLNQPITGRGSDKDIRHLEISLEGTGLHYQPGDALGVWPVQDDTLVARVLDTLRLDPAEAVTHQGHSRPLGEWLGRHRELTVLTRPFVAAHAERAGDAGLSALLAPESREGLAALMNTQQVLDLLRSCPTAWTAQDLVAALRPLAPRLYSIASSPLLYEDEVHVTLANVRYDREGEARWGVASRFLCGLAEGDTLPVYIEENERFRLPADGARDILMIGPGTGVAPFRAFVQERQTREDTGRNWLFFGNPHFRTDFLYQTEWQQALKEGGLHRLDLAFSRDQADKVYVQHRLLAQGAEVYAWIEGGAHVYVCGDATRMAPDVHQALLQVARTHGGLDEEGARGWIDALAADGRYVRDVY